MARLPCLLLLLCLLPLSSMAKDFWAIDCGNSEQFTSLTNTTWEPDDGYVQAGVSRNLTASDPVLQTLRAFEADKPSKGCYTIPVGATGTRVLVHAWFYYGNYDGNADPPTFELMFDANDWRAVQTSMTTWDYHEAIYVTSSNSTSICVAKGSTGQTPFISGITLAVLEDYMYDSVNASQALFMTERVAFGADNYYRDKYRRYWMNSTLSLNISEYEILTNNATINTSSLPEDPPPQIFQTAIVAVSPQSNITLATPSLPMTPVPIYFNMYFTDPEDPTLMPRSHNRSFHIAKDGQIISNKSEPVVPQYGDADQYTSSMSMGSNATLIDFVPTSDADKPPVISAWELFVISDLLSSGTDGSDVKALQALQGTFKTLQDWAGDPCLPKNYGWEWVTCSSDDSPRITGLNLTGYDLSGELINFSSLSALQTIDLSKNMLTGEIPSFLAELPNLKELNLADNDFSSIPSSLVQSNIKLDVSGNSKLPCIGQACSPAAAPQAQLTGKENSSANENKIETLMTIFTGFILYATALIAW